ncbi:MAG: alpha/beta hydrolase [Candidatus Nanopelagicales bacterium]
MRVEAIGGGDGVAIKVHSIGSGPGLVVLHGAGVTVRDYRRLADRLAPHLTVHLFNRRGRRDSAALTGRETAQTDLDDLAAVLVHTGARNLFGHSGGGFVALRAGLTLPVDRIATYDAGIALDSVDFPRGFIGPFDEAVAAGDLTEAFVQAGKIHPDAAAAKMPHWLQVLGVRAFLHTPPGKQMVDLLPTLSPEVHRILDHQGPASEYSTINAEVLLTYGSRSSQYFKDIGSTLADALPNGRALEIPRASHNTANIAPARLTNPLLGFFTGSERQA